MNKQRLIAEAKSVLLNLQKEERRSINPYASFAAQFIVLINNGSVSSKGDIRKWTGTAYSRPRMNRQWRTFGKVLEKNLSQLKGESLLYFFGYLKYLLTIEGKKEYESRRNQSKGKNVRKNNESRTGGRCFKSKNYR